MKRPMVLMLILVLVVSLGGCRAADGHSAPIASDSVAAAAPSDPTETTPASSDPAVTEPEATDGLIVGDQPTPPEALVCEERTDGLVYIPSFSDGKMNSRIQMYFALDEACYPGMTITYELTTSVEMQDPLDLYGTGTYDYSPLANSRVLMLWGKLKDQTYENVRNAGGSLFIEARIRANGYLVGYGVFEIGTNGDCYAVMGSKTVIFPMVDGKLQYSTEEYVTEKLVELEQIVTALDIEAKQKEEADYWASRQ